MTNIGNIVAKKGSCSPHAQKVAYQPREERERKSKREEKQTMVVETNALIDIRTMMIKTSNTSIAIRTVKKIDILIF
jgi:hypothetical protein